LSSPALIDSQGYEWEKGTSMGFEDNEGRQKAFGLWRAEDMLEKLDWERGLLGDLEKRFDDNAVFAALNGCATAWHLTEWTWHNLSPAARAKMAFSNVRDLQAYAVTWCPALRLCQLIGNGGKHHTLRWNDPAVASMRRLTVHVSRGPDGKMVSGSARIVGWKLQVSDEGTITAASDLLRTASEYWAAQLAQFRSSRTDVDANR
jgi:hypothetical protein